ncbi:unnamed protein product [Meganyctiphanes norvegica]|uniref:Uncharacterized protein n=1 Tax=Meganyctiphanes norvegica TaxID=48144 RepID=A0AAV2QCH0_MEGNR
MDWLPVVSQLKSLVQATFGDARGAKQTQENFLRQCPVLSQATSAVQAGLGDTDAARDTQLQFLQVISSFTDNLPVVGHAKGSLHYACGDKEGGDRAMKRASHMTAVMGAGVGGFIVGGPIAAVGLGVATGAAMDGITTGVEYAITGKYEPEGILRPSLDPKNAGLWFDAVGGVAADGVAGAVLGGKLVSPVAPQLSFASNSGVASAVSTKASASSETTCPRCGSPADECLLFCTREVQLSVKDSMFTNR